MGLMKSYLLLFSFLTRTLKFLKFHPSVCLYWFSCMEENPEGLSPENAETLADLLTSKEDPKGPEASVEDSP